MKMRFGKRVSVRVPSSTSARNKTKTQLIRVQRATYEALDRLRDRTKLPVTEIVAAMVAAALSGETVDFKRWRDELPAEGRATPEQRWLKVEWAVWIILYGMQQWMGAKTRLPIEQVFVEGESEWDLSRPQMERALNNFKSEGAIRRDMTRNEIWCEDWEKTHEAMRKRFESIKT